MNAHAVSRIDDGRGGAERVSLPRSSMKMMGFAVCCLCCSPAFSRQLKLCRRVFSTRSGFARAAMSTR